MLSHRVLCAIFVAASLHAAVAKNVARNAALNPAGSVRLETQRGSIHIATWDRPEIDVQARIEAAGSSPLDQRRFDQTQVAISSTPDSISIRTQYPDGSCCTPDTGNNPTVNYTIWMPRTARLTISDHRSNTEISDLAGPLDFNTHRGRARITFAAFTAGSRIETHRGSIEVVLPRASRFDLRTELDRQATIDSDFTMMARASHRGQLAGTVNGGGPILTLRTHRGSIHLIGR